MADGGGHARRGTRDAASRAHDPTGPPPRMLGASGPTARPPSYPVTAIPESAQAQPQSPAAERALSTAGERTNPVAAWYRRARSRRIVGPFLRMAVLSLGILVTLVGLVLVPLPGPGWAIVFVGLALTATEFRPARSLLDFARGTVRMWTDWLMERPMWVRLAASLATFALVAGITLTVYTYGRALLG